MGKSPLFLYAGNLSLNDLPLGPNIKTIDWAPQNDILGHPSVGAFVTQGGINSMHEAIFHAVPVVVTGLTADQPMNALKVCSLLFPLSCNWLGLLAASISIMPCTPTFYIAVCLSFIVFQSSDALAKDGFGAIVLMSMSL